MNILMIDTSGPVCGVALIKDGKPAYEAALEIGMTHSQRLMPMVDAALAMTGMTIEEIDLFGAVVGPGSFTGVRIVVSPVKAMAHAAGKPCIGIDALHALAMNAADFDGVICPILDARAQQVYGAIFRAGKTPERVMDDEAMKLTAFLDRVDALGERALFVGDGVGAYEKAIVERLGKRAVIAPAAHRGLRAMCAAQLALEQADAAQDYVTLLPLYLRAPQAERERAAKLAQKEEGKANG